MHPPLYTWNLLYKLGSLLFFPCLLGPWNPFVTSSPSMDRPVSWWISSAWIGYCRSSHRLLSWTWMIRNLVHYVTSPVVSKNGKPQRFMMLELKRLIKYRFDTNFIPPISSGATSYNMSMFICGNNTCFSRSRSRSFTCSTSTRGSHGSSRTNSLETELRLPLSIVITALNC